MSTLGLTLYSAWSATRVGITHVQSRSPKYMDRVHQMRKYIFATNLASLGFGMVQLARCIPKETLNKYRYVYNYRTRRTEDEIIGLIFAGALCAGLVAIGLYFVAKGINRLGKPSPNTLGLDCWYRKYNPNATPEEAAEMQEKYKTEWSNSRYQTATQTVYLCSLVTNCALAVFAKHAALYALLAILQMSSVFAVARWRFVKLSFVRKIVPDDYPVPLLRNLINGINARDEKYRYNYLFSVFQSNVREEANTYFCSEHRFHFPCILGATIEKFREMHWDDGARTVTGRHGSIVYAFEVARDKLPSCPSCRGMPSQNELGIDAWEGEWIKGSVAVQG